MKPNSIKTLAIFATTIFCCSASVLLAAKPAISEDCSKLEKQGTCSWVERRVNCEWKKGRFGIKYRSCAAQQRVCKGDMDRGRRTWQECGVWGNSL